MGRLIGVFCVLVLLAACAKPKTSLHASDPGDVLYGRYCRACHQQNGTAAANGWPALSGSAVVNGDPKVLALWVMYGIQPTATVSGVSPSRMPAYATLKDEELAVLLTYVRSHFKNSAEAVDLDLIKKIRAEHP